MMLQEVIRNTTLDPRTADAERVRLEILAHLQKIERKLPWLEKKSGINYNTLYACLVKKLFPVSNVNLEKINTALGTTVSYTTA